MRGYKLHSKRIKGGLNESPFSEYEKDEAFQTKVVGDKFYFRISPAWGRERNKLNRKPAIGMVTQPVPPMGKRQQRRTRINKLKRHIRRWLGKL